MDAFHYIFHAQEVIFGPGALARLGELTERFGWRRVLLCTTAQARSRGDLAPIVAALGARLAATYERVESHVPQARVLEATALAAEREADAVIGFGGGSAIGVAKAVSLALLERQSDLPARAALTTDRPSIPVIAVPTTYAGSEMTPVYGVTHPAKTAGGAARKVTVSDPRAAPRLI